jgi:VanZ family protein
MAAIFWMSSRTALGFEHRLPAPRGPIGNMAHLALFGTLGFLLARALDARGASAGLGSAAGRAAVLLTALYGLTDEIHQFFTPGRTCSLFDVCLDGLGAASVLLLPRPRAEGRPESWIPAAGLFLVAAAFAVLTGLARSDADRAIEHLLQALGFGRG